jgi:hypothetical protein
MSLLPRVTVSAREIIAREFDARGSGVCLAEIIQRLRKDNPEFLDMAAKCAADLGSPTKLMVGFGMFYRLLTMPSPAFGEGPKTLPRVNAETRAALVAEIDNKGAEVFTLEAIDELEANNPELLQLAHSFASGLTDYLRAMQGFALLYKSLVIQAIAERGRLH